MVCASDLYNPLHQQCFYRQEESNMSQKVSKLLPYVTVPALNASFLMRMGSVLAQQVSFPPFQVYVLATQVSDPITQVTVSPARVFLSENVGYVLVGHFHQLLQHYLLYERTIHGSQKEECPCRLQVCRPVAQVAPPWAGTTAGCRAPPSKTSGR